MKKADLVRAQKIEVANLSENSCELRVKRKKLYEEYVKIDKEYFEETCKLDMARNDLELMEQGVWRG